MVYVMNEVTEILQAIQRGETAAADQLLPLVYEELRKIARSKMAHEATQQTLQPTALVHEAYVRLVDSTNPQVWNSKGHFFGAAANAMRRILVENARRKKTLRRGGDRRRSQFDLENLALEDQDEFLLALDENLSSLEQEYPDVSKVVQLRYFAGLSIEKTAETMELSVRTVNRHWAFAKAWLYARLSETEDPSETA